MVAVAEIFKSLCCYNSLIMSIYPVRSLSILILLFSGFHLKCSLTTEPNTISDFGFGQRMIFTDPNSNGNPFFNYLNFDPSDYSRIYIGAVDFLYRLNADNISSQSKKSDNLTAVQAYKDILSSSLSTCQGLQKNANPNYLCRNHIRAAFPIRSEIYICSTGAYSPQEFYIDRESLTFVALGPQDPYGIVSSGLTKCPNDPDSQYTIIFVDRWRGTPNNLSAFYSSINSDSANAMYRSSLQWNRTTPVQVTGLQMPLQDVTFVSSYEIDQYVYYFFREIATEATGIGNVRYSRVARVCKNDYGSTLAQSKFLTFVKATLNCSVGQNDIPVYYNNLYDVQYDASRKVFYGIFMASQNGSWGSAICQYSYDSIVNKFDNGQFFSQEMVNTPWTITPDARVPQPRPSLCQAVDTRRLSTPDQAFALTHYLMAYTIDQNTTSPIYYNRDIGYSRLTVDVVEGFDGSYTVFCLYSDRRPNEIVRVVQWTTIDGATSSRIFSVLKPFGDNNSTLREMVLRNSSQRSWLYIVKDTAVFQISMEVCSQYELCTACVIDPYCGWNSSSNKCVPYATGLIQNVASPSPLTACHANCKVSSPSYQFCILGMAVHLNCLSHCAPEGNIIWQLPNGSVVQTVDPNFVLTSSGDLVILSLTSDLNGTFTCTSNNVVLAETLIKPSACQYTDDIQNTVVREFQNWCRAFEEYKTEYNQWLCLIKKDCSLNVCRNSAACAKA